MAWIKLTNEDGDSTYINSLRMETITGLPGKMKVKPPEDKRDLIFSQWPESFLTKLTMTGEREFLVRETPEEILALMEPKK